MTDYKKLVEALNRLWQVQDDDLEDWVYGSQQAMHDAAAAIEELQQIADHHERSAKDYWKEACEYKNKWVKSETDATNLTGKLAQAEAEVERLKDSNEELREKQTYIDHYGDKWMTSAKDVPTAAYEHGYMDGMDEAKAQLPKRGEWITIRLNNGGSYTGCSCCEAPIPTDTMLDYIPESESKYCYSCGAKMEVQE